MYDYRKPYKDNMLYSIRNEEDEFKGKQQEDQITISC